MWSGLWQMLLDLVCIALTAGSGLEDNLGKTLMVTTVAGLVVGLLFLGEFRAELVARPLHLSCALSEERSLPAIFPLGCGVGYFVNASRQKQG